MHLQRRKKLDTCACDVLLYTNNSSLKKKQKNNLKKINLVISAGKGTITNGHINSYH